MEKNNAKAASVRQQGNALYARMEFKEALKKYNESICWAENGTEDLGIGYANRSAVFLAMEEFEFALANVTLAKDHNYPQRMMPKLEARERICRQQLGKRKSGAEEGYRFKVDGVNPRIPFLSNDVQLVDFAGVGGRVVADRDFKAGDVLLQDRILLGWVEPSTQYLNCDYCTSEFFHSLIPCPHCVSVMYCGEDCRQKGWKHLHRFECGIAWKLHDICSEIGTGYIGPRLFFYGLSLFNDDVTKMQQFCKTHPRTGSNPFTLDYVNYDPLEEFKIIQTYKMGPKPQHEANNRKLASMQFFKAYQSNSLVKSLFATSAAKKFMQHCFLDYHQAFAVNYILPITIPLVDYCNKVGNVLMVNVGGQIMLVALQAISKGSQITLMRPSEETEKDFVAYNFMLAMESCLSAEFPMEEWKILEYMTHTQSTADNTLIELQNFLQKYSHLTSRWYFQPVLFMYLITVTEMFLRHKKNDMRRKVLAS